MKAYARSARFAPFAITISSKAIVKPSLGRAKAMSGRGAMPSSSSPTIVWVASVE